MARNASARQMPVPGRHRWRPTLRLSSLLSLAGFCCCLFSMASQESSTQGTNFCGGDFVCLAASNCVITKVNYSSSATCESVFTPCPPNATCDDDVSPSDRPTGYQQLTPSLERQNPTSGPKGSNQTNLNCSQPNNNTSSGVCESQPAPAASPRPRSWTCADAVRLSYQCAHGAATFSLKEMAASFPLLTNRSDARSEEDVALGLTLLLQSVQRAALGMAEELDTGGQRRLDTPFLAIDTLTIRDGCRRAPETLTLRAGREAMSIGCATVVGGGAAGAAAFISYSSVGAIMSGRFISKEHLPAGQRRTGFQLNSKVVSATKSRPEHGPLAAPVNLTFQHLQVKGGPERPLCVHWRGTRWLAEGCWAAASNRTHTVCSCGHFSSFAVLVATGQLQDDPMLEAITHVGLGLSLLCLLLAALTFLLCGPARNTGAWLHLHLAACLFLAHLLFLAGLEQTQPRALCAAIAGALHYLYLASFAWMLLEGLHLFLAVRNLAVANYSSARRPPPAALCALGYGAPAAVVAVSAGISPGGYGTPRRCWLNLEKGFIWSFTGPVSAIILVNLTFYLAVLWMLRDKLSSLNREVSTLQNTRLLTLKAVGQLFLLGCSWGLGLFLLDEVREPARSATAYAFTTVNSLQGVYVFMVHCVLSRQVQEEYRKCFMRVKKAESWSYVLSIATTHSHASERPSGSSEKRGDPPA